MQYQDSSPQGFIPIIGINALYFERTYLKSIFWNYFDQWKSLLAFDCLAVKVPPDRHLILLLHFCLFQLELTQQFSENIRLLFAVQIVSHPHPINKHFSTILDCGRKNESNNWRNKQIEVTEFVCKSRIRQTAHCQVTTTALPRTFSLQHIVQVLPSKFIFYHERTTTDLQKVPVRSEKVGCCLSDIQYGEQIEGF